jgi:membrane protease YdiL (CAAX protease family)
MTGELTSPQSAGTWRRFGAFVRRPRLPDQATGIRLAALPVLGKLFALDLLLMALLIGLAALATALGMEMPEHLLDQMEFTPLLLAFLLVGAPLGEELLFRGWLSGRLGHVLGVIVLALVTFIATGFYASQIIVPEGPEVSHLLEATFWSFAYGILTALPIALLPVYFLRKRPAMRWFQHHFRWFYFGSTLAFASIHLANFTEGNALILLPLTLPQFLLGLILGYARVQFGLWASMLLHVVHNSLFVGLLLAGAS